MTEQPRFRGGHRPDERGSLRSSNSFDSPSAEILSITNASLTTDGVGTCTSGTQMGLRDEGSCDRGCRRVWTTMRSRQEQARAPNSCSRKSIPASLVIPGRYAKRLRILEPETVLLFFSARPLRTPRRRLPFSPGLLG